MLSVVLEIKNIGIVYCACGPVGFYIDDYFIDKLTANETQDSNCGQCHSWLDVTQDCF